MIPLHFPTDNDSIVDPSSVDDRKTWEISEPSCTICESKDFKLCGIIFIDECDWDSHDSITLFDG